MQLNQAFLESHITDLQSVGAPFPENAFFCVDSRRLEPGNVFIALPGNRVDGHLFIESVITAGAAGIIIAKKHTTILTGLPQESKKDLFIGIVPDTAEALFALASAWRDQFTCPVIGITGSVGKTSTRQMLVSIIKKANIPYLSTEANNNTMLSISLSMLSARSHHRILVFEMGISKRDEMSRMAKIVRPTSAVITTIGHSHMEGLGSLNDIASEKRAIFSHFKADNIGIINGDLPLLAALSYQHPIVKFGCKTTNQIQARKIQTHGFKTSFILKLYKEKYTVTLKTNHAGQVNNALAAASIACLLGISGQVITSALEETEMVSSRFEPRALTKNRGFIIDDAYNANPESMRAALLAFEKMEAKGSKIAVLGDMLELGINSPFWHRQLGRFLRKAPSLNQVILVGDLVAWAKKTAPLGLALTHVATWQEAQELLASYIAERESAILVKGSHGTHLHQLVKEITK